MYRKFQYRFHYNYTNSNTKCHDFRSSGIGDLFRNKRHIYCKSDERRSSTNVSVANQWWRRIRSDKQYIYYLLTQQRRCSNSNYDFKCTMCLTGNSICFHFCNLSDYYRNTGRNDFRDSGSSYLLRNKCNIHRKSDERRHLTRISMANQRWKCTRGNQQYVHNILPQQRRCSNGNHDFKCYMRVTGNSICFNKHNYCNSYRNARCNNFRSSGGGNLLGYQCNVHSKSDKRRDHTDLSMAGKRWKYSRGDKQHIYTDFYQQWRCNNSHHDFKCTMCLTNNSICFHFCNLSDYYRNTGRNDFRDSGSSYLLRNKCNIHRKSDERRHLTRISMANQRWKCTRGNQQYVHNILPQQQ